MSECVFPKGFLWGVSTSAYQIEGAAEEDGRGPSIWDTFTHTPGKVRDGGTGDIACDHYHRYKEDIQLMKKLGIKAYRFSIAWPRIFPKGKGRVNHAGLDFYSKLIDGLLENDIVPMITLYHWDLPQALQDEGGWENRAVIEYFGDYAKTLFKNFGDRVKYWITLNEPWCSSFIGYFFGEHAPGFRGDIKRALGVAHNLLLSHGRAVEIFREEVDGGMIGLSNLTGAFYPASGKLEDLEAAQLADQFLNGWFYLPVAKGEYPRELRELYERRMAMPKIGSGDMELINTPIDFWGVNYYSRNVVKSDPRELFGFRTLPPPPGTDETDFEIYPKGLYDSLMHIKDDYADIPVFITENGMADKDVVKNGKIHDARRIGYLKEHIKAAHRALTDGVDLRGYFVWSLIDNFEWAHGYTKRFGIVYTDYNTQRRVPKDSGHWYSKMIKNNGMVELTSLSV